MFANLGEIEFKLINSFNAFEIQEQFDFAEHSKIEGKPDLQWVGDALSTTSIDILLHKSFCEVADRVKEIKDAAKKHEALNFVLGTGEIIGKFVITDISTSYEFLSDDGNYICIALKIGLKEYAGKDSLKNAQKKQKANAVAMKKKDGKASAFAKKDNGTNFDMPSNYTAQMIVRQ